MTNSTQPDKVVLWDLTSGKELCRVTPDQDDQTVGVRHLLFSPNGKRLATVHNTSGPRDRRAIIQLWEITGELRLRKVGSFRNDPKHLRYNCGDFRIEKAIAVNP